MISDHNDFIQNREHVPSPVDQLEMKCEASVVHELQLQDPVQCGCRCGKHVSLTFDLILPKYKTIQNRELLYIQRNINKVYYKTDPATIYINLGFFSRIYGNWEHEVGMLK